MTTTAATPILQSPCTLSSRYELTLALASISDTDQQRSMRLGLRFQSRGQLWACGELQFTQPWAHLDFIRTTCGDVRLRLNFGRHHWTLRLRGHEDAPAIEIVEVADIAAPPWRLIFPATTLHWHKQLAEITAPAETASTAATDVDLRLGAHSQHGQLFNFRDWFLAQNDGICSGMIVLRPGTWTHPKWTSATVTPAQHQDQPAAVVSFPLPGQRIRRSYLLVHTSTEELLPPVRNDDPSDLGRLPYAAGPARYMTRYGFARPERLANQRHRLQTTHGGRPGPFAFGPADALGLALKRVQADPALSGDHPFWRGDHAAAKERLFTTLQRFYDGLGEAGYLHPLGNPVSCRELGPAAALFHLLDHAGHLAEAERQEAAMLIADLANLLVRRDFYPWHLCHQPPEVPYDNPGQRQSLYRGMLNQNFHTDVYVFVGLAGCVLPQHPWAGRWRRHAVRQFQQQMRCFVWPFPDGYGCWEESHTYANHVKLLLLPLTLALRNVPGDDRVDLLEHPAFRAMCRFFVPLLSPSDQILAGWRGIPAVGDHGYQHKGGYGYLFGWLATLCPDERNTYLWAWGRTGGDLTQTNSSQVSTFSPLLQADPASAQAPAPPLPAMLNLPGFGTMVRRGFNTPDESLLLVRCGDAWGHYHPDEGSFWWYHRRQLLCADADLGGGPLKLEHLGHSALGFPNHQPVQHLDRAGYRVEACRQTEGGGYHIRCRIPFPRFQRDGRIVDVPTAEAPLVIRDFHWLTPEHLQIIDDPVKSPDGLVQWTLHLPAQHARATDERTVTFLFDNQATLQVLLPDKPLERQLFKSQTTWQLTCIYREARLEHNLHVSAH